MIAAIIAAEIAFWVLLLGGLTLRYLIRARRASSLVLLAVPLVDLALVTFVAVSVAGGAEPTQAHALAAIYLGVTVSFGHHIIRRTDAWFHHRFAGGPKPVRPPKGSAMAVRALWREWFRVVLAAGIAAVCLVGMIALEGWSVPPDLDHAGTHPYWAALMLLPMVTVVWFLAGPAFAGRGDPARDPSPPSPGEGRERWER